MSDENISWAIRKVRDTNDDPEVEQIYIFFGQHTLETLCLTAVAPNVAYYTSKWYGGLDTFGFHDYDL